MEGVASYKTSPAADTSYAGRDLDIVSGSMTVSANTGLQNQNVAKNTNNVKVGSYILKTGSSEGVRVTNLRVDVKGTAELVKLANLYISENNTPVLPQSQNNFPVNFTLNANETKTIDVYVDLGDLANDKTIITDLTATGLTIPSNSSISVADVDGQTMTVKTGSLAAPTLVNNSPVAKLVTGGSSNELVATYKFVASNSTIRLDDLKFKVAKDNNDPNGTAIQSLTVNGVTAPTVLVGSDYVVSLNGLNVTIPAGTQGMNVEVKANFNTVTSVGQGGSLTNNDVKLILTDYKYVVGNATETDSAVVPSNTMVLVAGAPVVADITPAGNTTLVAGANNEVMRFSVTAQNGMVNLNQVAVAAVSSYALTNAKVWIYDADNMATALNGAAGTALAGGNIIQVGATTVVEFDNDYTINAGATKNFVVRVDNTGVTASGDYFRMDLTNGNDTLNANTNWKWNDGTVDSYINSYLVKTLPITGKTFTRN